jgi:hypothetical protein
LASVSVKRVWRRGRDSNPRWASTHAAFRVRCIRPLCHLSGSRGRARRRGIHIAKRSRRNKTQITHFRRCDTLPRRGAALSRHPPAARPVDLPSSQRNLARRCLARSRRQMFAYGPPHAGKTVPPSCEKGAREGALVAFGSRAAYCGCGSMPPSGSEPFLRLPPPVAPAFGTAEPREGGVSSPRSRDGFSPFIN